MKPQKHLLLVLLLAFILVLSFSVVALANDLDDLEYPAPRPGEETTSMQYVASYVMKAAGLTDATLGTYPRDHNDMAKSIGLLEGIVFDPEEECSFEDFAKMTMNAQPLFEALRAMPMKPFFVNGMAQPIFPYGSGTVAGAPFDTTGEGVARFVVYVETDFDTDRDGKLDLLMVFVQLPRAAVEQGMKVATIYHAQPYDRGTNDDVYPFPTALQNEGQAWLDANGPYDHELLHGTADPRVPAGEYTTKEMVEMANPLTDWRYRYAYTSSTTSATMDWGASNSNQIASTTSHDYFLVRGFATVYAAGLGTALSDGIGTNFADIEIAAFAKVVEWLNGDAVAYSDKTGNMQVKADWSNGNVGMTGTSYGGTMPVGVATTGVKGLKTIIPVAAIMSPYEYVDQQGISNQNTGYTSYLLYYVISRMGVTDDWTVGAAYRSMQVGYLKQILNESAEMGGNYDDHWQRRDYSYDGWFKDWGPSKISASMLIVHGLNDNNVRPKQSILMQKAAEKGGLEYRMIWDQGHHMTPNNHMIGQYAYQEWQNLWFSHYLYDIDNHVLEMLPKVYAQDNLTGDYVPYDSWDTDNKLVLNNNNLVEASAYTPLAASRYEYPVENEIDYFLMTEEEKEYYSELYSKTPPVAPLSALVDIIMPLAAPLPAENEQYTVLNSANGTSSWQNQLDAPTAGSSLYSIVLPEDVTVKGVIEVHLRAAVETLGSNLGGPTARHAIHARLAEVAAPGETIKAFGTTAVGSTIGTSTTVTGGLFRGGGLAPNNIVRFNQASNLTYREIARGWMDLGNPKSGYPSYTSHINDRIDLRENIGVFHDYTLYLQPSLHTAKAGNRLALIISFGINSTSAYTGNNAFTVKIDNDASYINIPVQDYIPTTVNVNFPGVEGVGIQYYSAAGWVSLPGTYDDTCTFTLPDGYKMTSLRAYKGGMSYQFNGLNSESTYQTLDVPVVSLMVFGIAAECNIGVIQDNWAYASAPATVGAPNFFNVFDNGKDYKVQVYRPGFYPIEAKAINDDEYYISDGASLWVYFDNFYPAIVPEGVSNVWISSYDWAVRGANAEDLIVLLADWGNIRDAQMRYDYQGATHNVSFKLDGSDPFAGLLAGNVPTEEITVTQTVFGGSYNFNAINLMGAGYKYAIVSRPDTPGGVAIINANNQFAFNPQGAPTNLSRAGVYKVEVSDSSDKVIKIYIFTVI